MSKRPCDLKPGDTVWIIPDRYRAARNPGYAASITKVGRKWVMAGMVRFERDETWPVDLHAGEYSSVGDAWPDEATYR